MRQWPEGWQVSLAAIGGHYSFTRAELDGLTLADVGFYMGGLAALRKRERPRR